MTKAKKITLVSVLCAVVLLGLFMLFWYFGDNYTQFYSIAQKEFEIAGLSEGVTPQGMCYDEESGLFLYSGYMKDGSASRIYAVSKNDPTKVKYVTLKYSNDTAYVGHAGGIDTDGHNVWVAGDKKLCRFFLDDLLSAENADSLQIVDELDMPNGADFLKYENGHLWVGEFHKDGKYDTHQSHHIEVSNGTNKALSFCFKTNSGKLCAIDEVPIKALSTTSLVQGMEIYGKKIILSTSYSLAKSHILTYEADLNASTTKTFDFNGIQIDLYILDDTNLTDDLEAPCMSEELAIANGRVFVLFESACKKYGLVTRESLRNVYSFKVA